MTRPRRALIVTLDPRHVGGVQTMRRALEDAHDRIGLESTLAYARSGRRGRADPRVVRATHEGRATLAAGYWPTIEYANYWLTALALRREVRRFPIVHVVGSFHSLSLVPIVARTRFVSWVATPFVDEIESRRAGGEASASVRLNHALRRFNQALERWTYSGSAAVWTISDYATRRLGEIRGPGREPAIGTQRPPVDTAVFTPHGPRRAGGLAPYALWVGRLDDERKNLPALLRVFAGAAALVPALRLVLAGPGRLPDPTARMVADLGLGSRIEIPGPLPERDLAAAYRGAAVFLLTSRQEGLGLVVLEAQASGRPCIVMRCGGADELVQDGSDGCLVEQGDEPGMARALVELVTRPATADELGRRARVRVERESRPEVFAARVADLYARVFPDEGPGTSSRGKEPSA